jgi:hypothetical protein
MTIKADPELQHVLGHLSNAIRYTSQDNPEAARYELDSIEGLIFFDTDEAFVGHARGLENERTQTDTETDRSQEEAGALPKAEPLPKPSEA